MIIVSLLLGVEVFPAGQVTTLNQLPQVLAAELERNERVEQALVALLQLLRAICWLQHESLDQQERRQLELDEIVFYREDNNDIHRLVWMMASCDETGRTVEQCQQQQSHSIIQLLAPSLTVQLVDRLISIPSVERMIVYVEYVLFGPPGHLDEQMMQRWLDVERASVLNQLIRTQGLWRIKLSVMEEFRLAFLVSASPSNLIDASQI